MKKGKLKAEYSCEFDHGIEFRVLGKPIMINEKLWYPILWDDMKIPSFELLEMVEILNKTKSKGHRVKREKTNSEPHSI